MDKRDEYRRDFRDERDRERSGRYRDDDDETSGQRIERQNFWPSGAAEEPRSGYGGAEWDRSPGSGRSEYGESETRQRYGSGSGEQDRWREPFRSRGAGEHRDWRETRQGSGRSYGHSADDSDYRSRSRPSGGYGGSDYGPSNYGSSSNRQSGYGENRNWEDQNWSRNSGSQGGSYRSRDYGSSYGSGDAGHRGVDPYGTTGQSDFYGRQSQSRSRESYPSRYESDQRTSDYERSSWQSQVGRDEQEERPGFFKRLFGMAPKGYKRSDERIREDIAERFMQSPEVDSSDVSIEVSAGVVTLEGTVRDRRMKHRVEDIADSCMGVKDVDNKVRVKRESDDPNRYGSSATLAGTGLGASSNESNSTSSTTSSGTIGSTASTAKPRNDN
jgi:hypothetical protein